jgi:thioredoxin reductase (NADPH)
MNIIIYTKTGCPWCAEALKFLNEKKIPYEEREVRNNPKFFEELVQKSGQTKTPTLDVGGEILADTDAAAIEILLRKKGIL